MVRKTQAKPPPGPNRSAAMLRWMLMARALDEQAIGGGSDAASALRARFPRGREAVHVGAGLQARDGDWVLPGPGDLALWLVRGTPPGVLLARLMGKPGGDVGGRDGWAGPEDLANGIVAAGAGLAETIPVAAGIALANRMQGDDGAAFCFIEERAADRGDFHEGLNFAAVRNLPVVCMCTREVEPDGRAVTERSSDRMTGEWKAPDERPNDGWTRAATSGDGALPAGARAWVSTGTRRQISASAAAYGIPVITVDGKDAPAVHAAAGEAAARARSGGGPTLLVATLAGKVDPVEKLEESCLEAKLLTPGEIESLKAEVAREVETAARWAEAQPGPDTSPQRQLDRGHFHGHEDRGVKGDRPSSSGAA
jgi:TPP-dependent pyruvate/acetoin dehydrogenase alpha subunit